MKTTLTIIIAVALSLLAGHFVFNKNGDGTSAKQTTFDRIMATNTIRCGYYVFPPVTYRDPNTKELSGMSVDMMNEIAKRAGLKVEWVEEVNFANWTEGLKNNRFDVACTPNWPETPLARAVTFSTPMFYAGLHPLVRANDTKLLKANYDDFNKPDVRVVTQDGNSIDVLTRTNFPDATINSVPPTMDGPTVLLEIVNNKADMILLDKNAEYMYNKNSPNTFKLRDDLPPIKLQSFELAFNLGEPDLKNFLDTALENLIEDGTMERLVKKWEPAPNTFLLTAEPHRK